MKKIFLAASLVALFGTFQSCSKCGHCHTETTYASGVDKNDWDIVCGNDANESGSVYKAAKLQCEAWPDRMKAEYPNSTNTYTSSWVVDK